MAYRYRETQLISLLKILSKKYNPHSKINSNDIPKDWNNLQHTREQFSKIKKIDDLLKTYESPFSENLGINKRLPLMDQQTNI